MDKRNITSPNNKTKKNIKHTKKYIIKTKITCFKKRKKEKKEKKNVFEDLAQGDPLGLLGRLGCGFLERPAEAMANPMMIMIMIIMMIIIIMILLILIMIIIMIMIINM